MAYQVHDGGEPSVTEAMQQVAAAGRAVLEERAALAIQEARDAVARSVRATVLGAAAAFFLACAWIAAMGLLFEALDALAPALRWSVLAASNLVVAAACGILSYRSLAP